MNIRVKLLQGKNMYVQATVSVPQALADYANAALDFSVTTAVAHMTASMVGLALRVHVSALWVGVGSTAVIPLALGIAANVVLVTVNVVNAMLALAEMTAQNAVAPETATIMGSVTRVCVSVILVLQVRTVALMSMGTERHSSVQPRKHL